MGLDAWSVSAVQGPRLQEKEYNPDRNGAFWSTRPVLVTKRAISVGELALDVCSCR